MRVGTFEPERQNLDYYPRHWTKDWSIPHGSFNFPNSLDFAVHPNYLKVFLTFARNSLVRDVFDRKMGDKKIEDCRTNVGRPAYARPAGQVGASLDRTYYFPVLHFLVKIRPAYLKKRRSIRVGTFEPERQNLDYYPRHWTKDWSIPMAVLTSPVLSISLCIRTI